jgi:hypothetical protein
VLVIHSPSLSASKFALKFPGMRSLIDIDELSELGFVFFALIPGKIRPDKAFVLACDRDVESDRIRKGFYNKPQFGINCL